MAGFYRNSANGNYDIHLHPLSGADEGSGDAMGGL